MLIVVSLRFLARRLSKAVLWYDDWLMIPATVRQSLIPCLIMHINSPKKANSELVYSPAFCYDMFCLGHLE